MRYWTTTTQLFCHNRRCGRPTRQVVEHRVEGAQLVKKTTCYRCSNTVIVTGPAPARLLADAHLAGRLRP
jgi:hypothetical protein